MTLQSLQKIISIEDDLFKKEQNEQEKAAQWLQDKETQLANQFRENLAALELKIAKARKKAEEKAKIEADLILQKAKKYSDCIDKVEDTFLEEILEKSISEIIGCEK